MCGKRTLMVGLHVCRKRSSRNKVEDIRDGASKALRSDVVRSGANRNRSEDSIMASASFEIRTR